MKKWGKYFKFISMKNSFQLPHTRPINFIKWNISNIKKKTWKAMLTTRKIFAFVFDKNTNRWHSTHPSQCSYPLKSQDILTTLKELGWNKPIEIKLQRKLTLIYSLKEFENVSRASTSTHSNWFVFLSRLAKSPSTTILLIKH